MAQIDLICQLLLATFLGSLIGLEREMREKEAGLRTYALVSLGSCIFTIISLYLSQSFGDFQVDVIRIVQAVAIGVGFIGAGTIFKEKQEVKGLTTAAGLWGVAAIGVAVGVRLYFLATFATFLTIIILAALGSLEEKFFQRK